MKRFFIIALASMGLVEAKFPFFIEGQVGYAVGSLWPYVGLGNNGLNTGTVYDGWVDYSIQPRRRRHPIKGVTGGIHFGKDFCLPRLPVTFGLMLGGNVMNVRGSTKSLTPGSAASRAVFKDRGYMDIAFRMGAFWFNTLFFAKIGCSWQFFKVTLKNSGGGALFSLSRKPPCLLLGVGMDVWISKVCLGMVANVHAGRRMRTGIVPGITANLASAPTVQIRPVIVEMLATFKYSLSGKQCVTKEDSASY
jgi:hypothetical protein